MDLYIGQKIQTARKDIGLTQEQAAEVLDVSRQTISNWENNKFYPDIISVIRMSEIYDVSLDYLLKGEKPMSNYYDYLEESINVVKSNTKRGKLILVMSYTVIWAIAMIAFWFFTSDDGAMGYSLMYLWIILPVTTLVVSLFIGKNDYWGKLKWLTAPIMGVMYMLAEYGTFSMANNIAFHKVNAPEWGMILIGAIISAIGIALGSLAHMAKRKKDTENADIASNE